MSTTESTTTETAAVPLTVVIHIPGSTSRITWPAGWPAPHVGHTIDNGASFVVVQSVNWMPHGDPSDADSTTPIVYVVAR